MLITVHYKFVSTQSFITLMMAVVTAETCQFSNLKVSSLLLNSLFIIIIKPITGCSLHQMVGSSEIGFQITACKDRRHKNIPWNSVKTKINKLIFLCSKGLMLVRCGYEDKRQVWIAQMC